MLPPSILLSQMNEVVAEGDICRFILQSKVSVEQAIYTEIVKYEATVAEQRKYNGERCADPESADAVGSCLLYTSPSPRDGLLSRMPSSA